MSAGFVHVLHPHTGDKPLRDQRTKWLGMFAHVLHIRSWEIGRLPVRDFRAYVAWLTEYNSAQEG